MERSASNIGSFWLWRRRVALVLGLTFGCFWFFWGLFEAIGYNFVSGILELLAAGGTLLLSTFLATRWPLVGGALLLAAGLAPLIALPISGHGVPALALIVVLPPLLAGLLFLSLGRMPRPPE